MPHGSPPPIARYSPGISARIAPGDSLLFVSGQVACDGEGRTIGIGDAARQTEFVFQNLEGVLEAAGGKLSNLVSLVIYITDLSFFDRVSAVRNAFLDAPPPASTLVVVSSLAIPEHLVEISAIAIVPADEDHGRSQHGLSA